jgi:transposase, IS30 family
LKGSRGIIKDRIGIENRPSIVDNKHRIGDLEIDLVIGQHHKYALLTIVDRALGTLNMAKINSKEADEVAVKVIELLSSFTSTLHTITSDNGKEWRSPHEYNTIKLTRSNLLTTKRLRKH